MGHRWQWEDQLLWDTSLSTAKWEKGAVFRKAEFIPLKLSFYCEVVFLIVLC